MRQQRVAIVGGGLAGLAATMKLCELGIAVDLFSLVPVKRSHSVCAQGGINSCNDHTRQLGDSEWKHFDDTVYGGDFLNHQPPVHEMALWAPKVIDLMDRLGVPFNRTDEGFIDRRRFGGTLYKRTAFAGATTGQQLLYGLDEQVRRWESQGLVRKFEYWDFQGPVLDSSGVCRGLVAQDLTSMEIRSFPADVVVVASGGPGLIYGRSTMSMMCNGAAASRCFQAGAKYGNGEFIQVHPTAIPGADKLRLMSESARGEGGRVWVPRTAQDQRAPQDIPESERYYFLEERYPEYGNLVPRDIATREIFDICVNDGLSVEQDRLCVYLDLTHISKAELDRKLGGILDIYQKFQGVDPRVTPMKIFPAVHYSMGGLWADYERTESGRLTVGSPRNQQTSIENLYAIGECDYHYHGANRLGANSLLSCIFTGLFIGPGIANRLESLTGEIPSSVYEKAEQQYRQSHNELLEREGDRNENPYRIHQELGEVMTKAATVVRRNEQLEQAYETICDLAQRARRCALSDTGNWTNQNVMFWKSLNDMFPLAKTIVKGALQRDECRGAHFKPDFAMPSLKSTDEAGRRLEAEQWCDRFQRNTEKWLKSSIAVCDADGNPEISYEDVDTSLIPPRPRLYGLVGAEVIDQVWKERQAERSAADPQKEPALQQS